MNLSVVLWVVDQQLAVHRRGDRTPGPFLGRLLISSAMASSCSWLWMLSSVPLGRYWRTRSFMFSLVPFAMGCAVHGNAGLLAELLTHGHLPTLVVRHAQAHRLCNAQLLVREGLQDVAGLNLGSLTSLTSIHVRSTNILTALALPSPLDEITFPVPGELAVFNLGQAHMDAQPVRYLASTVLALALALALALG